MTDRKKPGVAFWATVAVVVVLVAYPLSFGPACWLLTQDQWESDDSLAGQVYWPIGWLAVHGPWPMAEVLNWYATLWISGLDVPCSLDRHYFTGFYRGGP
jgi:hypothetical protein